MRPVLVRIGFLALGAIYVAMGVVSARVALLGARDRENGVPGALHLLLEGPHGAFVLGAVVAGVAAIALAHVAQALRGPGGVATRAGLGVNGLGYAALAWTGTRLLLHVGRPHGALLEREGVSWLLSGRWGAALLELVGTGVVAGGLWEAWQGLRGRLPLRRDLLPRRLTRGLIAVSRFGLLVRGAMLVVLGGFLIRAAERREPALIRTIGGALDGFARTGLGPAFLALVAAGLAAYGVYFWALALLRRRV